jgi:hypothetical protein
MAAPPYAAIEAQRFTYFNKLPLQRFAVKLTHNYVSTPALAQEGSSEEKHALIVRVAQ